MALTFNALFRLRYNLTADSIDWAKIDFVHFGEVHTGPIPSLMNFTVVDEHIQSNSFGLIDFAVAANCKLLVPVGQTARIWIGCRIELYEGYRPGVWSTVEPRGGMPHALGEFQILTPSADAERITVLVPGIQYTRFHFFNW